MGWFDNNILKLNKMSDKTRRVHVSPGVYSKETELTYAAKSLGITTLGMVGETLMGPAFEPISISKWDEFKEVFGGTSTEKYRGTKYPKYEAPYIAKSYLKESEQLNVVRVLGLSGYNAGPAWVIGAKVLVDGDGNMLPSSASGDTGVTESIMPIAVIRSRGDYKAYEKVTLSVSGDTCDCPSFRYDSLVYRVGDVKPNTCGTEVRKYNGGVLKLKPYFPIGYGGDECSEYTINQTELGFDVNSGNLGKFKLCGLQGRQEIGYELKEGDELKDGYFEYAVSLNPYDKDYIIKVLGNTPTDGDAPIFVESLYDVAYEQLVGEGTITSISSDLTFYCPYNTNDYCSHKEISGIVSKPEGSLTKKDLGRRFLADYDAMNEGWEAHLYDKSTKKPIVVGDSLKTEVMRVGQIYTVVQYTDATGKRKYFYRAFEVASGDANMNEEAKALVYDYLTDDNAAKDAQNPATHSKLVKNLSDGYYYRLVDIMVDGKEAQDVTYVTCDLNNYKSSYRYASTPWIVSNIKGDSKRLEMNKLFRFHTISDGKTANNLVKVSIQNIRPDDGTFDVIIRAIDDSDTSIVAYERFTQCNLVPGDSRYLGLKIGTFNGDYEGKSKFVTVEINESTAVSNSVPAGFVGYPTPRYNGVEIVDNTDRPLVVPPVMRYNQNWDQELKSRKQYFGFSTSTGVDIDAFTFKGANAYGGEAEFLTPGFHLDWRADKSQYENSDVETPVITVDGDPNFIFDGVSRQNATDMLEDGPVIGSEAEMSSCIYSDAALRKFTVYFYGGFDGWDEYRSERTNGDEYQYSKYKGMIDGKSGEGYAFNVISDPESIGLDEKGITSDYYAWLAGIRQFANPEAVDMNLFVTPGIDYVNNKMLVESAIDMIEDERMDSLYVVTTPDKPEGAEDDLSSMYTADDVVDNLDNSDIDSNYACTYYPWVKYEDTDNHQYIMLPATKDVVRNMAMGDNVAFPWFAPAGLSRGDVECVKAKFITKLSDEDTLYENRINFVKSFADMGVKIWGQKTLSKNEDSKLTRISTRRLLIRMRKLITVACLNLIFEPNDAMVKDKFINLVGPILDGIRGNRGISDYRIVVDDSVEARMNRELPAKIFFKPIDALEWVDLDFVITPENVSFDEE